jgi:hypothetical protein
MAIMAGCGENGDAEAAAARAVGPAAGDAARLLRLVLASNLALLVSYALFVNWQMQGRYLLPSLGAITGCAALATRRLDQTPAGLRRFLAAGTIVLALAAALAGLVVIRQAYG